MDYPSDFDLHRDLEEEAPIFVPKDDLIDEYQGNEEEHEEEEEIVYDQADFISGPVLSEDCTIPEDFITLHFSFSYESTRKYNICLVDSTHVLHWSGCIIHIVDIENSSVTFRRCADSGIGFICSHPSLPYFAVGEKGVYPNIIIYEWPNFNIINVLKRGTKVAYSHLDFSPDGELLASTGDGPDYTLTIWNWKRAWVILRTKAHSQTVFLTKFSNYNVGHLTSCGLGHIKFWTMADTFTGLKLPGVLGKFGKTPMSDISTIYGLPNSLTLAAIDNGNFLVWDGCNIKLEVSRGKEPCHLGTISYFEYDADAGDLTTVGTDGKHRVWDFSRIEKMKPKGDRKLVKALPSYENEIKDDQGPCQFVHMIPMSNDPASPLYYYYLSQDYRGSIWKINLELRPDVDPPKRLFFHHCGPIVGMDSSPGEYYLATLGFGGKLIIRNILKKKLIMMKQFPAKGSAMKWLPLSIDQTGTLAVLGFVDGTLRLVSMSIRYAELSAIPTKELGNICIQVIQVLKPHSNMITSFAIKEKREPILASGSIDGCIFVYKMAHQSNGLLHLKPVGLMTCPGPVYTIYWKEKVLGDVVLACCTNSLVVEAEFPKISTVHTGAGNYVGPDDVRVTRFKSIKKEYLKKEREKKRQERKMIRIEQRREELAALKAKDPTIIVDEGKFFSDMEESQEEEELNAETITGSIPLAQHQPDNCTIYFAKYIDGRYWLSPSGYDAGFVYLYQLGENEPSEVIAVHDAEDIEINVCEDFLYGHYKILGLGNGRIRVVKIHKERPFDFADYMELKMHDMLYGRINKICFSHDFRYIYSCGNDSNLFSYEVKMNEDEYGLKKNMPPLLEPPEGIDDNIPPEAISLQEQNASDKQKVLEGEAAELLQKKLLDLYSMGDKIDELWELNDLLPEDKRLTLQEMELHPKFAQIMKKDLDEKFSMWLKKYQFTFEREKLLYKKVYNYFIKPLKTLDVYLEGIKTDEKVKTFRVHKLTKQYVVAEENVYKYVHDRMSGAGKLSKKQDDNYYFQKDGSFMNYSFSKGRTRATLPELNSTLIHKEKINAEKDGRKKIRKVEGKGSGELPGLEPGIERFLPLLNQREKMLYNAFIKRRDERKELFKEFEKARPNEPDEDLPANPLLKASEGLKLKTDPTYRVPTSKRITKELKLFQIMRTSRAVTKLREEFNRKIFALREYKMHELLKFQDYYILQKQIREEISEDDFIEIPEIPQVNIRLEYPELYYSAKHIKLPIEDRKVETPELIAELFDKYSPGLTPKDADMMEFYRSLSYTEDRMTEFYKIVVWPRIMKLKILQAKMAHDVNTFIETYDKRISDLILEKIEYDYRVTYLDLYLETLCREMIIIRKYQYLEDITQSKINVYLGLKVVYKFKMYVRKKRNFKKEHQIENYNEKIKSLFKDFNNMVGGSKFAKHLTKIFKKKYKPPKKESGDDDSDTSSSSESESSISESEDDEMEEVAAYKYDETICPDGCDPHVFSRVFKLRESRHEYEAKVVNCKKEIFNNQHEMTAMKRVLKIDSVLLAIYQLQMDRIARDKQNDLNQINILLLLNSSQIQNWDAEKKEYILPQNMVVVSLAGMKFLKDYKKGMVGNTATMKETRKKQMSTKMGLKRELKRMEERMKALLNKKKEIVMRKFGVETDFYAVDLESMRRLLLSKSYDTVLSEKLGFIKSIKNRMYDEKAKLAALKKMHANNLFTLAAIEEEKYKKIADEQKILETKSKLYEYISVDQLHGDIENLEHILNQQVVLKERLKGEIRNLKFKDRPPIPPMQEVTRRKEKPTVEQVEVTESETYEDLDDLLQYMCGGEGTKIAEDLMNSMIKHVIPSEPMSEFKQQMAVDKGVSGEGFFDDTENNLIGLKLSDEIISETLKDIITDTEETQSEAEKPTRDVTEEDLLQSTKEDKSESGELKGTSMEGIEKLDEEPTHEGELDKLSEQLSQAEEKGGKPFDAETEGGSQIHEELIADDDKSGSQYQEVIGDIESQEGAISKEIEVSKDGGSEDIIEIQKEEGINESQTIEDSVKPPDDERIEGSTQQEATLEVTDEILGQVVHDAVEQGVPSEAQGQETIGEELEKKLETEDTNEVKEISQDQLSESKTGGIDAGEEGISSQIDVERESAVMELKIEGQD